MNILRTIKSVFPILSVLLLAESVEARMPDNWKKRSADTELKLKKRVRDCVQGSSRFDMDINNVRAALLSSGDVWWDLANAVYVVPKVAPGSTAKAVSAIFAGAVWLGGKDPSGNLKVACQSYRSGTATDFWPGPLDKTGNTEAAQCERWDKHFVVYRTEIDSARALFRRAKEENPNDPSVDCALIPENLRGWPATGNPHFFDVNQFTLPRDTQGLAKFFDEDGDRLYDPCKGDFPIIDVEGCESITAIPDQMIFWIYNDNGNTHTQSTNSTAIQMEVQVQAFAYQTNDELNDMTFQRYKLINRAVTDIDSMFFAMWVDPDLGCPDDDYVGCDTTRDLMFVYNQDAVDGTTGDRCNNEIPTYGSKIPILGVDYFRGPKDEFGRELGMSSFTYYLNSSICNPLPATTDPQTAEQYYNYLTGRWRDGAKFSFGGSGYNPASSQKINYAFTDAPSSPTGWSMATAGLPCGDRRTIQASGPFKLRPGAVNELIIGVPWVADQQHPAPDISRLQEADDIAQSLFNNCFKIFDGPSAPDVCPLGFDQEIVLILTNNPDSTVNNNARERYVERGLKIPASEKDTLYKFQGYKIYQLQNENVGVADLEDVSKSRLIFQVDIQDSVSKIFNWTSQPDPNFPGRTIYTPVLKTDGLNQGIRYTFSVKEDRFATGDNKRLINNKKYYFVAIAYAYNNYAKFDEKRSQGQAEPFVVGRLNIGDKNRGNKPYEVTPRAITNIKLGSSFGEGISVTRLDGVGTGNAFLDLTDETVQKILDKTFDGTLIYKQGRGPINIKIYNPLEVLDGEYELTMRDNNLNDNVLANNARWTLKNLTLNESVTSDTTLAALNEQVIAKFGFSVTIGQVAETRLTPLNDPSNGAIGSEIIYENKTGNQWLTAVEDDAPFIGGLNITNYLKTNANEPDLQLDPNQSLSKISPIFKPYYLLDYVERAEPYISPAWQESTNQTITRNDTNIQKLNNINIVFTKDKSKWSRCVVIESASRVYFNKGNNPDNWPTFESTQGGTRMFDLRRAPSVGKEADAQGRPRPDGDGQGMSWFPGYAIDVETGKRLNIFFGENTAFDPKVGLYTEESAGINRDMVWNPSSQAFLGLPIGFNPYYASFFGGQHFVYVTSQEYDECRELRRNFASTGTFLKSFGVRNITWAGIPYVSPNSRLLSYANGLIPNDVTIKLRVRNPYAVAKGKGTNQNHPSYRFVLSGKQPQELSPAGKDSALNAIRVVPNPYYGFSAYERSELSTTIKLTNLPAQATVTIYTLDGKYVRQFKRDERPVKTNPATAPGVIFKPIETALEWDLKNEKGIPVGSGVYLIHVATPEGERTLKFFAVQRKFDASRL
ncbi:MAG: hypothetical protein HC817_00080 [Saprospiraceae bacterium]|nr:hypothetical protein [Saprospiraceae bacterium]